MFFKRDSWWRGVSDWILMTNSGEKYHQQKTEKKSQKEIKEKIWKDKAKHLRNERTAISNPKEIS